MKKILIVDDATFMRLAIKEILIKNGFAMLDEAANGMIAINKYKEFQPDIVLMDITMPDMNGIEALKAIMEIDSNAKVVMVSAMGQETMVMEAIKSGARSFILKPFKDEQLIQTLNKI